YFICSEDTTAGCAPPSPFGESTLARWTPAVPTYEVLSLKPPISWSIPNVCVAIYSLRKCGSKLIAANNCARLLGGRDYKSVWNGRSSLSDIDGRLLVIM